MPTEATFRFSTYLTFALACVALGYAQSELLPEIVVFAVIAVVVLGMLYFLETRVTMLSIPAANRLGIGVSIVYFVWFAYRIQRELDTGEFNSMGWHMLFVAMCGPLIMMVLAAKAARSDKHAGDYWTLHGAAFAGVGLAAAFAEDPICFALVGLYLLAAVWSLTLFHLNRSAGTIPNSRIATPKAAVLATEDYGARTDFRPAILCAIIAVAVAVPVYLLTPRSQAEKADFGQSRIEIGYAADQMVNLNRTGPLKTNGETAFTVTAAYLDGRPKTNLDPEQRWRGKTLRRYENGEWKPLDGHLPSITRTAKHMPAWSPPDFGEGQFTLTFEVPAKMRTYFLADPIVWLPDQPTPIATITNTGPRGWMPSPDGTFYGERSESDRRRPMGYAQAYRTRPDSDLSPGVHFVPSILDDSLTQLRNNPVTRVKEYADQLLADLVEGGQLPREWRDPATRLPREELHDRIARAFTKHLSTTPTLRYTTNLSRANAKVDPIEDFLFHSKAGHCERFATALTLMLRSQGIPAVFVLGFKGCEHVENGTYIVKQEHAHAWVESLVSLPLPQAERGTREPARRYHWRSLDPTPAGEDTDADANGHWWHSATAWLNTNFQEYFTNYTPDQRRKALANFFERATKTQTLLSLAGIALLLLGASLLIQRRANASATVAVVPERSLWFSELLALLIAHDFIPAPGETAREFADRAAADLRERPACSAAAAVPIAWAEAYYQERFGDVPLTAARRAELDSGLAALRRAITK